MAEKRVKKSDIQELVDVVKFIFLKSNFIPLPLTQSQAEMQLHLKNLRERF